MEQNSEQSQREIDLVKAIREMTPEQVGEVQHLMYGRFQMILYRSLFRKTKQSRGYTNKRQARILKSFGCFGGIFRNDF